MSDASGVPDSGAVAAVKVRTTSREAWCAGIGAAALQVALTAPLLGRYGWDRDELYFRSAAHHPALGYVDFPPLTAWLGWLVDRVDPDSLVALRLVSLLAGALTVLLVAFLARELGGGRAALWFAAIGWALTPYVLGSASIFHPTWLDALAWVAFLYVATRLLLRDDERLWPVLGVIAGLGLEAKYTIAVLLAAGAVALLADRERRRFRGRGPWIALAIALALLAPNLIWQAGHGWPSAHFVTSQNAQTASDTSRPAYLVEQLLFLGGTAIVAAVGVVWLWHRRLRALALVPVLVTLGFLIERGRSYYPLPADALPVAAGAVALTDWMRRGRRLWAPVTLVALQAAVLAVAAPIVVPVYSTAHMVRSGVWKTGFFDDELGWPELAAQTERAWRGLPQAERARGAVLAANYGEASALALYGHGLGPVLSGHLSWQFWRPAVLPQRFALTIGEDPATLHRLCRRWHVVDRIDNRWHVANEERGGDLATCALRHSLGALWHSDIARNDL